MAFERLAVLGVGAIGSTIGAYLARAGRDITLITYSRMTLTCFEAAAALEKEGISVEVVDLRSLVPLDKYLLVSDSFGTNYEEALKLLSAVLGHFQGKPVFTAQTAPAFPRGLDKLTMELVNLDMQGLNNLWGNIGGKYLPSVLYKARMFTLQEGWITERVERVPKPDASILGR